jgi:hypothetical protein
VSNDFVEVVLNDALSCFFASIEFKAWRKFQVAKNDFFDVCPGRHGSLNCLVQKNACIALPPWTAVDGQNILHDFSP